MDEISYQKFLTTKICDLELIPKKVSILISNG